MRPDEAYACLRLAPDAGRLEVERAYQRQKRIYSDQALAIQGLLNDEERRAALARIEEAYQALYHHWAGKDQAPPAVAAAPAQTAPASETPGGELRRLREERGFPLTEVAHRTNISPMNLEWLEREMFDRLPAPVYLKGFLSQYLSTLGITDPDPLIERYLERRRACVGGG